MKKEGKKDIQKMIVFDVDGVLLNNKMGGFKDILVLLGKEKDVQKIDEEYQRRKHVGPWGLKQLAKLYQGFSRNKLPKITVKYCQENLVEGAREYLIELKAKGYILGAISSNPQFIMDVLVQMLPLNFSEGTQLEFKNEVATGRIQRKVDRYAKAKILLERIKIEGLKKENIIVIGDSIADLAMAELAGIFIAFRPEEDIVKERADLIINNFQESIKKGLI